MGEITSRGWGGGVNETLSPPSGALRKESQSVLPSSGLLVGGKNLLCPFLPALVLRDVRPQGGERINQFFQREGGREGRPGVCLCFGVEKLARGLPSPHLGRKGFCGPSEALLGIQHAPGRRSLQYRPDCLRPGPPAQPLGCGGAAEDEQHGYHSRYAMLAETGQTLSPSLGAWVLSNPISAPSPL